MEADERLAVFWINFYDFNCARGNTSLEFCVGRKQSLSHDIFYDARIA